MRYLYTEISNDKRGVDILLEYVPAGSIKDLIEKFGPLEEKLVRIYTK